jgi:hypothetical protein
LPFPLPSKTGYHRGIKGPGQIEKEAGDEQTMHQMPQAEEKGRY